jgi:hypothetical protein
MPYTITTWDRATFKRCRRAWDFGSIERRNLDPVLPLRAFDLEEALRYAMTVYYFPAMWDWSRAIVRPLVLEGFVKSMREQRERYERHRPFTPEQQEEWFDSVRAGQALLRSYFEWAPTVDRFETIRVETEIDLIIPDPVIVGAGLTTPEGDTILYRERLELLVADSDDRFWLVTHRLAGPTWADEDELVLDEEALAQCWACEEYYVKVPVAGSIHNELRIEGHPRTAPPLSDVPAEMSSWPDRVPRRLPILGPEAPPRPATEIVAQTTTDHFRRTTIARSQAELEGFGKQLAALAHDITDTMLRVYPTPSWPHCRMCPYRSPCIALNEGEDAEGVLRSSYRDRGPDRVERGKIGPAAKMWFAR